MCSRRHLFYQITNRYTSQAAAGAAYQTWVCGSASTSYVIALNKCEYIDRYSAQPTLGLKPGMVGYNGTAHEPFATAVKAANARCRADIATL